MKNKKKITLVCFAKNEDLYLQEWIDYHLKLKFDTIHIFQNDWRFKNPTPNKKVFFHEYDGKSEDKYVSNNSPVWVKNIQAKCYTEFIDKYHEEYEWAAFFDVDEFLVLKKTNDVKEFIEGYKNEECLIINWAMFGDSGIQTFDESYPTVLQRFTKRQEKVHGQFKSICRLKPNSKHNIHWIEGSWVDPNFYRGDSTSNDIGNYDVAQLNHYFTKTYDEFMLKIERGNACYGKRPVSDFHENNFNDVEDTFAKDFFNKN